LSLKRSSKNEIIDLTTSNPTKVNLDYSCFRLSDYFCNSSLYEYNPSPTGNESIRSSICDYYSQRRQIIDKNFLLPSASTSEAYSYIFKLLCNPGEEILFPLPGYPLLYFLSKLESIQPIGYTLKEEATRWIIDFENLENSISNNTKAIIFVNPNNPTGTFFDKNSLQQMISICKKYSLALIVDEVFLDYCNFASDYEIISAVNCSEIVCLVLSGLSKIAALPQLKLSWIYLNAPSDIRSRIFGALEIVADTYLSVSTQTIEITPKVLQDCQPIQKAINERIKKNYAFMKRAFTEIREVEVCRYCAGWYGIIKINEFIEEEDFTYKLLSETGVYVHPGYFYDFQKSNFLVLSLIVEEDIFQKGTLILASFLSQYNSHNNY